MAFCIPHSIGITGLEESPLMRSSGSMKAKPTYWGDKNCGELLTNETTIKGKSTAAMDSMFEAQ